MCPVKCSQILCYTEEKRHEGSASQVSLIELYKKNKKERSTQ